jgi:parallel beta helix pectate lyase-like protein
LLARSLRRSQTAATTAAERLADDFTVKRQIIMKTIKHALTSLLIILASALPAAAVPRVFVSGLGNDANPGSITSPKRSFASALTVTDPGGEIIVLDSAGYGPVTVNKSVRIICPTGVYAGVTVTSGDGIVVSAGASDTVVLRGLTINSAGGTNGINFTSGAALHVENCVVGGFVGNGDVLAAGILSSSTGQLFVADTVARENFDGVYVTNGTLSADRCRMEKNSNLALAVDTSGKVSIRQSVASGNIYGFVVATGELNIDDCLVANNSGSGILTQNGAVVRVSNSTITDNGTGLNSSGGSLLTRGNNTVQGNATNKSGAIGSFAAD